MTDRLSAPRARSDISRWMKHDPFIGEEGYLGLLSYIMEHGEDFATLRTGETTRGIAAPQLHFDLAQGFPLITTKQVSFRNIAAELLWFIEGGRLTNGRLNDNRLLEITNSFPGNPVKKTVWTANAEAPYWKDNAVEDGDLGRIYGAQWRMWDAGNGKFIDQLAYLINKLRKDPSDRQAVVSSWNPGELPDMALPPCHVSFQVKIYEEELVMIMTQRSADMFLGVPYNIASYALLAHILGQILGVAPRWLTINLGDAHIYHNHVEQVKTQLSREILPPPQLRLDSSITDIDGIEPKQLILDGYASHPALRAPMAV